MYSLVKSLLKSSTSFYYFPLYIFAISYGDESSISALLMVIAIIGFLSLFDFGYVYGGIYGINTLKIKSLLFPLLVISFIVLILYETGMLPAFIFNDSGRIVFYIIAVIVNINISRLKVDMDLSIRSDNVSALMRGLQGFLRWGGIVIGVLIHLSIDSIMLVLFIVDVLSFLVLKKSFAAMEGYKNEKVIESIKRSNNQKTAMLLSFSNMFSSSVVLLVRGRLLEGGDFKLFFILDGVMRLSSLFSQISNRILYVFESQNLFLGRTRVFLIFSIFITMIFYLVDDSLEILFLINIVFCFASPFFMRAYKHSYFAISKLIVYSAYLYMIYLSGVI